MTDEQPAEQPATPGVSTDVEPAPERVDHAAWLLAQLDTADSAADVESACAAVVQRIRDELTDELTDPEPAPDPYGFGAGRC